jgi:Zn-dependent membrane protease YugP
MAEVGEKIKAEESKIRNRHKKRSSLRVASERAGAEVRNEILHTK